MRKRRILAVAAAATLALSMVGCGSGGSSSGGSSSSGVANKDKPLCWFNRQPSNSSTGELAAFLAIPIGQEQIKAFLWLI